jgi:hypothetical protein
MKLEKEKLFRKILKKERESFLENYPKVEEWYKAKGSCVKYLSGLMRYCEAVEKNPNDLLELKAKGGVEAEKLLELFQTEFNSQFGREVKGRRLGIPLGFSMTIAVKSFYNYHGYTLARRRAVYPYSRVKAKGQLLKEDLIPFSDMRSKSKTKNLEFKTIVAFLSSIPVRRETLSKLDWYHVREALDDSIRTPCIQIEPELLKKSLMEKQLNQIGFLHTWAREMILKWREHYEKITGIEIDISKLESLRDVPLFITARTYRGKYQRLRPNQIDNWFEERAKQYGKEIHPHSFRAFFKDGIKCSEDFKAVFLAQTGKHDRAYTRELIAQLKDKFLASTPELNPQYDSKAEKNLVKLDSMINKYNIQMSEEAKKEFQREMSLGLMTIESKVSEIQVQLEGEFVSKMFNRLEGKIKEKTENEAKEEETSA